MAEVTQMESLTERQDNEVELLKAVYSEDLKDLRENDAWKVCTVVATGDTIHCCCVYIS